MLTMSDLPILRAVPQRARGIGKSLNCNEIGFSWMSASVKD